MLILTRRQGQQITIGPDILITVCETRSGGVRLGIEAPRALPVVRTELLECDRMTRSNSTDAADDGAAA